MAAESFKFNLDQALTIVGKKHGFNERVHLNLGNKLALLHEKSKIC